MICTVHLRCRNVLQPWVVESLPASLSSRPTVGAGRLIACTRVQQGIDLCLAAYVLLLDRVDVTRIQQQQQYMKRERLFHEPF